MSRFHAACILIAVASTSFGAAPPQLGAQETAFQRLMNTPINISFENTPLKEVFNDLRDMHGVNIVPDKPALDEAGVSLECPISMKLERIALKSALNLILHQVKLAYIIKGDVILITTQDRAEGKLRRVTYQVADLVNDQWTEARLIDLVTKAIAPRSWVAQGGKGTIEYVKESGQLTVLQTLDAQEEVQDMLASLRRHRDKEVQALPPPITLPPAAR